MHTFNPNTKETKGFITYYTTYCITTLKKHVDRDHATIFENFEGEIFFL